MAYGSKNNRKKILSSIVEGADGGSIMGALEASMKEEDNRSRGRGAVSAAKSLEDTYEKVSSMKRSLGEQTTKTNEAINKSRSSDSSIAKDWMTVLSGQAEADKPANDIKRSEMLARRMADPQTVDDIYLDTGKLGPRGTVLDVPYVPSDNPDDAPITYSGDQAAGASGRTAAIDAALREALGEDEEEGTLSPDDMPITRANTDFPSRIGMDNTRGLMSKTEEAITEEAITEEAITEEATPDLIDFAFIMEQEGFEQDIYVPRDEDGVTALDKSGPTIASGFDLGQRNLADLAGLPPALISKLEPYLGLKKQAAIDFIKANPLNITEEEASIINTFAKDQETGKLIKLWNKTSKTPWEDLTSEQATVVASVAFQFGNLSTEAPKFWGHVTKGNWDKAIGELRNFGGPTPSRRIREADYLESGTA